MFFVFLLFLNVFSKQCEKQNDCLSLCSSPDCNYQCESNICVQKTKDCKCGTDCKCGDGCNCKGNVFFDISIGQENIGTIEFELFDDVVPYTAGNFRNLSRKNYHGSIFHRVIPDFMIQGGDYERRDGTGGKGFSASKFEDENFQIKHTGPGLLSMANSGPNTNGAQFFITLVPTPWLDGKHVVFGKVIKGMEIVQKIAATETTNTKPRADVVIKNAGVVQKKEEKTEL